MAAVGTSSTHGCGSASSAFGCFASLLDLVWRRQPAPPRERRGAESLLGQPVRAEILAACLAAWPTAPPDAGGFDAEGWRWTSDDVDVAARAAVGLLLRRLRRALEVEQLIFAPTLRWDDAKGTLVIQGALRQGGNSAAIATCTTCRELAEALCALCGPEATEHVEKICVELEHSLACESLALAHKTRVWESRLHSQLQEAGTILELVQRLDAERGLLLLERLAAFDGHPTHCMAKMKLPLSFLEVVRYSPEFGPTVPLRVVAVRAKLLKLFPSPEAWDQLWEEHCPQAKRCLERELPAKRAEFALVLVHPACVDHLQNVFVANFASGDLRFLEGFSVDASPTLSFRTLTPQATFSGSRAKLPVPVRATSLMRYVSPVEVWGSQLLGRALRRARLPAELCVLYEDYGCHLEFGGEGQPSYEDARYCSMLLRTSPAAERRDNTFLVPLAALFARRLPAPTSSLLLSLWAMLWRQYRVDDGARWFEHYAGVILKAQLGLFLRYGLAMEAHQQNAVLEFDAQSGRLNRLIYQELAGGIFWDRERMQALPTLDITNEVYERDDIIRQFDACLVCVKHTMLRQHLLPLADEVAAVFGLNRQSIQASLEEQIERTVAEAEQDPDDRLPKQAFGEFVARTRNGLLGNCAHKALLRMRLLQTKEELYIDEI